MPSPRHPMYWQLRGIDSANKLLKLDGLPPITTAEQVADVVARRVQWYWGKVKNNGGGEWCGTDKQRFMRLRLTEKELANRSTVAPAMHQKEEKVCYPSSPPQLASP